MAGKPNIRSIRFSDKLAELIDRQVGNTFHRKIRKPRCPVRLGASAEGSGAGRGSEASAAGKKRPAELRKRRVKLDQTISNIQRRLDYHLREPEGL